MPATTTTTEVFPSDTVSLESVQTEQQLRIKAGAIRSVIDQSDPAQYVLRTEWNVLGQNDDAPTAPPQPPQPTPAPAVPRPALPAPSLAARVPAPPPLPAAAAAEQNVLDLATVIMSEASVGTAAERLSVAFTVVNRMLRANVSAVRDVWRAYSHAQQPVPSIVTLARDTLGGQHADPTGGCTHYYSPRSMPAEGQPTAGFDVAGGLELVPPLGSRTFAPSWARTMIYIPVSGVRPEFFKFFRS